ncbi:MAG TPA: hypothetical protein VFC58_01315 [Desulfosporosinus sp.]|nr:hypothetical protein [Desulfosporosinus sp.]
MVETIPVNKKQKFIIIPKKAASVVKPPNMSLSPMKTSPLLTKRAKNPAIGHENMTNYPTPCIRDTWMSSGSCALGGVYPNEKPFHLAVAAVVTVAVGAGTVICGVFGNNPIPMRSIADKATKIVKAFIVLISGSFAPFVTDCLCLKITLLTGSGHK